MNSLSCSDKIDDVLRRTRGSSIKACVRRDDAGVISSNATHSRVPSSEQENQMQAVEMIVPKWNESFLRTCKEINQHI